MKIVTFGTSLTASGGWQPPLRARLERCLSRPVEVDIVAMNGATSEWALGKLDAVAAYRPDVVLVEFYANDASLRRLVSLRRSTSNIETILDGLRKGLPQARIVLTGMNPFLGMRGLIRPFINDYIEAHREAGASRGVEFFDHRPNWLKMSMERLAAAIPDGTHPRPEDASAIIVPAISGLLAGATCMP